MLLHFYIDTKKKTLKEFRIICFNNISLYYIMSYLQRTGNSRNNISWTNTSSNSIKYLHRTGTGRTNIKWSTISTSANILQRNGTGRNNILWANLTVMTEQEKLAKELYNNIKQYNGHIGCPHSEYNTYGPNSNIYDSSSYLYFIPYPTSYPDSNTEVTLHDNNILFPKNSGESNSDYVNRLNNMMDGWAAKFDKKNIFTKVEADLYRNNGNITTFTNFTFRYFVNPAIKYEYQANIISYGSIDIYFENNSGNGPNRIFIDELAKLYYK